MMNSEEMRARHDPLLDGMCRAGFLNGHNFKDGQGYMCDWTLAGHRLAKAIKRLRQTLSIENPGQVLPVVPIEIVAAKVWQDAIATILAHGTQLSPAEEHFLLTILSQQHWCLCCKDDILPSAERKFGYAR